MQPGSVNIASYGTVEYIWLIVLILQVIDVKNVDPKNKKC